MVYGSEIVLPVDLVFGAPRVMFKDIAEVEATQFEEIDTLEEERLSIVIQTTRYQQSLQSYHDSKVCYKAFSVGDLVL